MSATVQERTAAASTVTSTVEWTDPMRETLGGALYGTGLAPLADLTEDELEAVIEVLGSNLRNRHRRARSS